MERIFDQASLIKTIKDGIKKGYWTLKDIDRPPPGWTEVVNDCKGNPLFPQGYQGVKYRNFAFKYLLSSLTSSVKINPPTFLGSFLIGSMIM